MRLFVGIELPEGLRRSVGATVSAVKRDLPVARWVRTDNLHLTLKFLGRTEAALLPELTRTLAAAFARHAPMRLQLSGAGWFPPKRPARVVWIGLERSDELLALQRGVASALDRALGLDPERRPYHPHLTLARCSQAWPSASAERWSRRVPGAVGEAFAVERGVLVESQLSPAGSTYSLIGGYPLGGAP